MFDTIFLDRDGTINGDPLGYINSLSDYHFYDYTFEALDILKKYSNNFVIVTNQSGLAKGKLDINNLKPICARCNLSMGDKYTIEEWNNLFLEEGVKKPHKLRKRKFKKYF